MMQTTQSFSVTGNLVDILQKDIYPAEIFVENGIIIRIDELAELPENAGFILPGFVDAHVHIESSMLVPAEFARLAVVHGTVATVSDPHEIANVCGLEGVDFMIENGKTVPFKFNFGAPSCVPATVFETAGASLNSQEVALLLQRPEIKYLSEMMNFPGVLYNDDEVLKKIAAAKALNKPVDGHAPGLMGEAARKYIAAGISTDHECFTAAEALDKLTAGMKILIREGSAAKNFDALAPLLNEWYAKMMFCSDDKHPDSLAEGHINQLCARAVALGIDVFKVLQVACINPVKHYKLDVGLLHTGDPADFIVVNDLVNFEVLQTWINGQLVAQNNRSNIVVSNATATKAINQFNCAAKKPEDFVINQKGESIIPIIEALDGQLITNKIDWQPLVENGIFATDPANDILKIAVVNRYREAPVALGFIKNFGLKKGGLASSVAHDSHNIVAVGLDDESLCRAVNLVIAQEGGVSATNDNEDHVLALPVAGLMSMADGYEVAAAYTAIDQFVKKDLGSTLASPFMTLSFMALLVIPHLKLSDLGMFDGDAFKFV